ncbi:MAG TPA: hypothetical protein VK081_10790 [Planctomycetota bacterium]|nr:hypothetical protein [Planctomycetota bacterium]
MRSSFSIVLRAAFVLGAAVQLGAGAVFSVQALRRVPGDLSTVAAGPAAASSESMRALLALPDLLASVPDDAPVLVVSTLAAVQLEYFVLPRPMLLLQDLPQAWIDLAQQFMPEVVDEVRRRRERLDRSGRLLTDERLVQRVGEVGFVVVAGPPPPGLALVRDRLVPRGEQPGFALFEVRR